MITAGTVQIQRGMEAMDARKGVPEIVQEISRIESQADAIYQTAVGELFEEERDAIAILKWKEILDMLEGATDRCKDVANVVEGIFVKHA